MNLLKFNKIFFILFAPLILSIGITPSLSFGDYNNFPTNDELKNYAPDTLLVKFKKNIPETHKKFIIEQSGAMTASEIPQIKVKILKVPEDKLDRVMFALSHNPHVEFVEKDYFFEPSLIPNDPKFSNQWHLQNIQADLAWDISSGSTSVPIAILDTGIGR